MGDNDFATGYAIGQSDSKGNGGGIGMWGDQGWWVIIIFALLFGWGGNGWGGNNNGGGGAVPYLSGVATRSDVMDGFALNDLQRGVSGIQQGICDSTYALNNAITNGFNSTNMALCQGFNGVERQASNIGFQLQDCCCQTQRAIDGVNYNMATNFCAVQNTANNNTRDIIQSTHNDTDRIISQLNQMEANRQQEKIQALQTENQTLRFQASQTAQNGFIDAVGNTIVAQLRQPSPVPAYTVPAPYPYAAGCGCNSCGCSC